MIRANDIVYNVSNRSVFDIPQTKYESNEYNDPQIPKEIVEPIEPFGSGPPSINNMNGILISGIPRCFVNPVLGLNTIVPGEGPPSDYGTFPMNPMKGIPRARPMPPRFIA